MLFAFQERPGDGIPLTGSVLLGPAAPAPGATVSLFLLTKTGTGKPVQTGTDSTGAFRILVSDTGWYRMEISFTGYAVFRKDSLHITAGKPVLELPPVTLTTDSSTLQEAVVVHPKPMFENRDGTITMNVESVPTAAGSSSADLLKQMPMVSTDPEGRVVVRGKPPIVLIDEKPVEMNAQQLNDLLESLPGSAIEKIELMQHPPPQYAGNEGGVINIVTKKGAVGWTGKASLSAGTIGQAAGSLSLNYRSKKLVINTTAGLLQSRVSGHSASERKNQFADSSNVFETEANYTNQFLRPNLRVQTTYDPSAHHQYGFTLQVNGNHFDNESLTTFSNINRFGEVWKLSRRSNETGGNNLTLQAQAGYTWFGKTRAEKLQVVTTLTPGVNHTERLFKEAFLHPDFSPTGRDSTQRQDNESPGNTWTTRIDYQKPLGKKITLMAGTTYGRTLQDQVQESFYLNKATGRQEVLPALSNDNRFLQQIWTARAGMTWRFAKTWSATGNLQMEGTHFSFSLNKPDAQVGNDYLNLLPSLTLRKDINKLLKASMVYRKSIRRPGMQELSPAVDYSDPYNLRFGNPSLRPSQVHQFDLNLNWSNGKSYINGSLGFNHVGDIINRIRTLQTDGNTYATFENIATRKEYEAGLWSGYSFSKKWRLNLSASYAYNAYGRREKEQLKYRDGSSVTFSSNGIFTASPVLAFDAAIRYNAYAEPQGRSRSNVSAQFGGQYKMLQRRLIVALAAIDPFTRQEIFSFTSGPRFEVQSSRTAITRNYRLTLSWVIQTAQKSKKAMPAGRVKKPA